MTTDDAETYLAMGITARDVVRLRWPDATDDDADFVLWERTVWPMRSGLLDIVDMVAELPDELTEATA